MLPSYYACVSYIESPVAGREESERNFQLYRKNISPRRAVSGKLAQKWKDIIEEEVKLEKQRRLQNDGAHLSVHHHSATSGPTSRMQWFERVKDDVDKEYQLNDAQQRAFDLFVELLKLTMHNETGRDTEWQVDVSEE